MAFTEDYLRALQPEPEPEATLVNALVATVVNDQSVARAEHLAARSGFPIRTLQRLFRRYLGLSPTWIFARYRIHDALGRVHAGSPGGRAHLALELGSADQAHFIRDFKALAGRTPGAYQASRL
jgi:AraC-like DNA-binding protein